MSDPGNTPQPQAVELAALHRRLAELEAQAQAEVRAREERLHVVIQAALDAVVIMDHAGRVADWNPAADRMFGYSAQEIVGQPVHDVLVPPRYRDMAHEHLPRFHRRGDGPVVGRIVEFAGLHRSGHEFPIELAISPLRVADQWWAVAVIRDLSSRKATEASLLHGQQVLRHVLDLHERERQLLADELHDELVQPLIGALMEIEAALPGLDARRLPAARQGLLRAIPLLRESAGVARRLMGGLRPPILDAFGIVSAVEYLVAERQEAGGPTIELEADVAFRRLASPLEAAVFRIVQEALHNAQRHSGSPTIHVALRQRGDRLELEIQDWGRGFDPQTVPPDRFGLESIRQRARLFGGRCEITSTLSAGTRIWVELPIVEAVAPADAE